MKEVFEKIVERLREESNFFGGKPMGTLQKSYYCNGVEKAIEIVKQVAEEYGTDINVGSKDGWIPCSERLPERNEDVLVTVDVDGEMKIATATYLSDDEWLFDDEYYSITLTEWEVIAWQPLPAPYKPKGE